MYVHIKQYQLRILKTPCEKKYSANFFPFCSFNDFNLFLHEICL